ncbi:MAG TPA: phosphoenolpyruvate carboxykinase (ATP) [Phnomibacter sp.]|nr:phosphoenolpyruvate carboxykinase (ATP) [Phnomibacter sp.]
MTNTIAKNVVSLKQLGIRNSHVHYQLCPDELTEQTLLRGQGTLSSTGALAVNTGKFTGRSPQDKYIVKDAITTNTVHWNNFNIPIDEQYFLQLKSKLVNHLSKQPELWVRDGYACADNRFRLNIRVVNENPWSNLFAYNLFQRPTNEELEHFTPDWIIMQAPSFEAEPRMDGTRSPHFAIISFQHKMILIGGTGYTGEMKKGIFTILNYLLPMEQNVLSMHCSANVGKLGDTAIFFGLSGTGKTTLSADPERELIGDDEHGWTSDGVFNFEGGCYAKCIDLTEEKEPEIFAAIRPGALLENIGFIGDTHEVDFASKCITENTRVSYPLHYISNARSVAKGSVPKNIFFLTCDANGVLPPISKLSPAQAMYHFISGYTAKVAGTEAGVTEPKSTFSACFGAPFLPLHPGKYAQMLGEKMRQHEVNVWMINTGWNGGPYGIGKRIKLDYTRAMITAALNAELDDIKYTTTPYFNLQVPVACPGVPAEILNPSKGWTNAQLFNEKAIALAKEFLQNFEKYASGVNAEVLAAAPKVQ